MKNVKSILVVLFALVPVFLSFSVWAVNRDGVSGQGVISGGIYDRTIERSEEFQQSKPLVLDTSGCRYKGFKLYGKIQVVDSWPDIKVQIVESFPDLKVKVVENWPDDCGKWQFVDSWPDLKIQFVEHFADIKIKFVESFPGKP
jgi:hypothetical protein